MQTRRNVKKWSAIGSLSARHRPGARRTYRSEQACARAGRGFTEAARGLNWFQKFRQQTAQCWHITRWHRVGDTMPRLALTSIAIAVLLLSACITFGYLALMHIDALPVPTADGTPDGTKASQTAP